MQATKKFYFTLILLSLACLWLGQHLGQRQGLLIAFFLVFALNTYVYYFSDLRIKHHLQLQAIEGHDPWGILEILNQHCQKAYVPVPKVFLSPFTSPTAINFGKHMNSNYLVLSEKLLTYLNPKELEALLAIEVARIKHLDSLALAMFGNLMALCLNLAKFIDYVLFLQFFLPKQKRWMPMSKIFLALFRLLYFLCIPNRVYYEADALAARLVQDPKDIAQVLWKLESYTATQPMQVPHDMAHLFVVNPLPKEDWYSRLGYQPNFEQRIRKLIGYFPI